MPNRRLPKTDYYNRRVFPPSEIGGGPRYLTAEEIDAFRVYESGGFLSERQSFLVGVILKEREDLEWIQDPDALRLGVQVEVKIPDGGSASVNVDAGGSPVSVQVETTGEDSNDVGRLATAVGLILVGVVLLYVLRFVSDFWSWIGSELPWSLFLFVPIPVAIVWILFRNRNRSPYV